MTSHSDFISIGIPHPFEPGHGLWEKLGTSFPSILGCLGTCESTRGTLNLTLHRRHFVITAMIFLPMNMWVFYEAGGGCMSPELLLSCDIQSGHKFHTSFAGMGISLSSYTVLLLPQPQQR